MLLLVFLSLARPTPSPAKILKRKRNAVMENASCGTNFSASAIDPASATPYPPTRDQKGRPNFDLLSGLLTVWKYTTCEEIYAIVSQILLHSFSCIKG